MIVCHCCKTNDRTIRNLIRDGYLTLEQITAKCGAGGMCGGCLPAIQELIDEETLTRKGQSRRHPTPLESHRCARECE